MSPRKPNYELCCCTEKWNHGLTNQCSPNPIAWNGGAHDELVGTSLTFYRLQTALTIHQASSFVVVVECVPQKLG
jgi:hypothetical protein